MKIVRLFAACALVVVPSLLTGCVSSAFKDIRVEAESDPKSNLGAFETYAWVAAAAAVRDPEGQWSPSNLDVGAEIVRLVDNQLQAAGKAKVNTMPDLLLAYGVGVDMKAMGVVENKDTGGYRFERIPKGGLMVVFIDPRTGRAIWAGAAEADVQENPSSDLVHKRLDYAITEMFKQAPL